MKTLLRITFVCIVVWILARGAIYALPGDPADFLVHDSLIQIPIEQLRARMDLPSTFLERIFTLPKATSLVTHQSATTLTLHAFSNSLILTLLTLVFTTFFSVTLLFLSFRYECWKKIAEGSTILLASFPLFLLSPLVLIIFSIKLNLFPVAQNPLLPALTLSFYLTGFWYRTLSRKIATYLPESAAAGARARGLEETQVFFYYVLYPCIGSMMGFLGSQIGVLFNGSVLVEIIFQWNGLGRLITDSVLSRDYPLIENGLMVATLITLICQQLGFAIQRKMEPRLC